MCEGMFNGEILQKRPRGRVLSGHFFSLPAENTLPLWLAPGGQFDFTLLSSISDSSPHNHKWEEERESRNRGGRRACQGNVLINTGTSLLLSWDAQVGRKK